MKLTVRPMSQPEFLDFRERSAADYAAEKVESGQWPAEGARERALAEHDELLPDGPATANTRLLTAEDERGVVGLLWIAPQAGGGGRAAIPGQAWIYLIEIVEGRRGQGLGRALLAEADAIARADGYTRIGLNVFGANTVARRLYESSGYTVDAQQMSKPL